MEDYKQKIINHHEKHITTLLKTENRKIEIIDSLKKKGLGLDIGCGTGLYLHKKLIGIDISPKSIKIAQTHGEAYLADAEKIPFDCSCFDYVICLSTLYYIENQQKVFDEVYRVLKIGGEFHFDMIDKTHPKGVYWKVRYKNVPQFFSTRRALVKDLKKFRHIDITQRKERITVIATK